MKLRDCLTKRLLNQSYDLKIIYSTLEWTKQVIMLNREIHGGFRECSTIFSGIVINKCFIEKDPIVINGNKYGQLGDEVVRFKLSKLFKGNVKDYYDVLLLDTPYKQRYLECEIGKRYSIFAFGDDILFPHQIIQHNYSESDIDDYLIEYNERKNSIKNVEFFLLESPIGYDAKLDIEAITEFQADDFFPINDEFKITFPITTKLLEKAVVSNFTLKKESYNLLCWHFEKIGKGGLLFTEPIEPKLPLPSNHSLLVRTLGGMVDYWNIPNESWLQNMDWALIPPDFFGMDEIDGYDWLFETIESKYMFNLDDYYPVAKGAGGDFTFCHKENGRIYMFAFDHSFDYTHPVKGCPEYSFYEFNSVQTFKDWIEQISNQLLNNLS